MFGDNIKDLFSHISEVESRGNLTAKNVSDTLFSIAVTKAQEVSTANKAYQESVVNLRMKGLKNTSEHNLDNMFVSDINLLLDFLRTGLRPEQAYAELAKVNDNWKQAPDLKNILLKYAVTPEISSAARMGATYGGDFDTSTNQLVFNYPNTREERSEMI